uniref:MADS34 n=1 Tax=Erycina pusilla TaxID=154679 RepID=A0A1L1WKX0_9ASPA|nr:MADS34 [Erycina pusilla]
MVGKGRKKTDLKLIEKKESRLVCFSKRRAGFFKKAKELSILTGANIGAVVFSPAGKLFSMETKILDYHLKCPIEEAPFWWNKSQLQNMSYEQLLQFQRTMLEFGEKKFGVSAEDLLNGTQESSKLCNNETANDSLQLEMLTSTLGDFPCDEHLLLQGTHESFNFCSNEIVNDSLHMEMEMLPSIFDSSWDDFCLDSFHDLPKSSNFCFNGSTEIVNDSLQMGMEMLPSKFGSDWDDFCLDSFHDLPKISNFECNGSTETVNECFKMEMDEQLFLQGIQEIPYEENLCCCGNDSFETVKGSLHMETEKLPSTFSSNFVFDDQQFDGWMTDFFHSSFNDLPDDQQNLFQKNNFFCGGDLTGPDIEIFPSTFSSNLAFH